MSSDGDGGILQRLIVLERSLVVAYDGALRSGLLSGGGERLFGELHRHEQAHAQALETALRDLGGTPPAPPEAVDPRVRDARSEDELLRAAIALESDAVAAHHDAQRKLNEARLLQSVASIMASEGQHLVLLRQALGRDPVPDALETGR